jgi:hypothetical protein
MPGGHCLQWVRRRRTGQHTSQSGGECAILQAGREILIGAEPLTGNAGWLELIEEFRALGGVAENICLGNGERGRGLFPCDPSRPVRLRVPENLLVPIEDVAFVNDRFCVAPSSKLGVAERKWVEHYANAYTWGAGGRAETENFLAETLALPDHIRETLIKSFGMTFCSSNHSPALVQERFLNSRVISYGGNRVVMPMVELVNHDGRMASYDCTNGVAVGGKFDAEVLVDYGGQDSFAIFLGWGFVSEAKTAMSLPMEVGTNVGKIWVKREFDDCHSLDIPAGKVLVPIATADKDRIEVSFLMLGARGFPRIPKGMFHRVFRDARRPATDEPFELIQFLNRQLFLNLLKDMEALDGVMVRALRSMCRLQLDALSHCYGTRAI